MLPSPEICYRALVKRDRRFDGAFFTAVRSTGIYCRPVCPSRTPLRRNCEFFPSAAAAEREGYRPCLRCRPERAPGESRVDAAGRIAAATVAGIELSDGIESLARSMGISGRHLRRVTSRELGAPPTKLAQSMRLRVAKRLLTETALPVTRVAFASGFRSLRRFNAVFREHLRLNPLEFRRRSGRLPGAPMRVYTTTESPIGTLTLVSDGKSLTGLHMHPATIEDDWKRDDRAAIFREAKKQLVEYFSGARTRFDLPLAPEGTPFQLKVWEALREIPYGETRSYADIARYVGSPKGFRAVGLANGANPIAIVVPCHRVIGADGSMTGFGGGIPRKRKLLELERRDVPLLWKQD